MDMDPSNVKYLKEFVVNVEDDFTILHHPDLEFFRDFLHRLGAKIPAPTATTPFTPEVPKDSSVVHEQGTVAVNTNRRGRKPAKKNSKVVRETDTSTSIGLPDNQQSVPKAPGEKEAPKTSGYNLRPRIQVEYPTSRTPYVRRKKAVAPRSKVRRNSGTTTGQSSQVTNPLNESAPINDPSTVNESQIANLLSEAGPEQTRTGNENVSDPIEAPDVFDNSASLGHDTQDVSHNSGLLGHDTDHSEPEKIYLGWEHHGIKSQKAFDRRWVSYKALERWLKANELCCILLNPENFDKFEKDAEIEEFGAHVVEPEDLAEVRATFKRSPELVQPKPMTVGPYRILGESLVSSKKSGAIRFRCIFKLDDPAMPLYVMQTRCAIAAGQPGLVRISERLADSVAKLEKGIHSLMSRPLPYLSKQILQH